MPLTETERGDRERHGFRNAEAGGIASRPDRAMGRPRHAGEKVTTSPGLSTAGSITGFLGAGLAVSHRHGHLSATFRGSAARTLR